ncbi:MAG: regulatory protein GemA [Nevskiaceae bacterium]|nr:MAG: regulatory protein GemA [Nevskiaceae bacterium]
MTVDRYQKIEVQKIQILRRKLKMDDDTYRDMLRNLAGVESTRALSMRQRHDVIAHLVARGANADQPQPKRARSSTARLIHALWKDLAEAGKVRDSGKEALRTFCTRMVHPGQENVTLDPDHLTPEQSIVVIEALKAWLKRSK